MSSAAAISPIGFMGARHYTRAPPIPLGEPPPRLSSWGMLIWSLVPAVLLSVPLIAVDPELRPPAGSVPRENKTGAAEDSLPQFGEPATAEEAPEVVTRVPPVYPPEALKAGLSGTVVVSALVGRDGHVKDTRVTESIPGLDAAAQAAVRQWVFKPAKNDGKPVSVWVTMPIKFTLHGGLVNPTRARFDSVWTELRRPGPRLPSETDAILRERLIRLGQGVSPPLEASDPAKQRLRRALVLADSATTPSVTERAMAEVAAGLQEAPWWADLYYMAATLLERAGRRADAAVALDLYLVADPRSARWEQVRRKLMELRQAR